MRKWVIFYKLNKGRFPNSQIWEEHYESTSNFGAVLKFYDDIKRGVLDIDDPEEVTGFSVKEEV